MAETNWTHRTIIVSAAVTPQARSIADQFGPAAQGMWTTALSDTGSGEATHYISTGLIDQLFADMLVSPEALQAGAAALGVSVPLEMCQALLSQADVSEEEPFVAMARLGLQMIPAYQP